MSHSRVTCHSGGASRWKVCYQRGLPCLVCILVASSVYIVFAVPYFFYYFIFFFSYSLYFCWVTMCSELTVWQNFMFINNQRKIYWTSSSALDAMMYLRVIKSHALARCGRWSCGWHGALRRCVVVPRRSLISGGRNQRADPWSLSILDKHIQSSYNETSVFLTTNHTSLLMEGSSRCAGMRGVDEWLGWVLLVLRHIDTAMAANLVWCGHVYDWCSQNTRFSWLCNTTGPAWVVVVWLEINQ